MLSRRGLFGGLAALAAPAIIRTPGLLMPIKRAPNLIYEKPYYDIEWPLQAAGYEFGIYADDIMQNYFPLTHARTG